jgi:hypothetical protein
MNRFGRCPALSVATVLGLLAMEVAGDDGLRQDGRFIPRLQWTAPPGELPGTYAEYIAARPPTPAWFADDRSYPPAAGRPRAGGLALLVDSALHAQIQPALDGYLADLAAEGYAVCMATVSGGTPVQIKDWVRQRYASGDEGVVFIGDITAAWAEISGDSFPCDLFYMDLDGYWADLDQNGTYEVHTAGSGDEGPEVYVARLYTRTLTYAGEAALANGYFDKAHRYRVGQLTQPWRGLEYVDEDWYNMYTALNLVYTEVERYDFGYTTTATGYLDQLDAGRHFVQVCAHSYSGGHHFGRRPTQAAAYAHLYVYSPVARYAHLRLGADDGIKAWLNGVVVLTKDVYTGWVPDQYVTMVTLNEGWNRLLCKVSQEGGDYKFSARFTDLNGNTLSDLQYQINDPDLHGAEAPYIRSWLMNGFHQDVSGNFWNYLTTNYLGVSEAGLNPQAGQVHGGKTWTQLTASGAYVDLDNYGGGADYGATYAFARIHADAAKSCQLWLGYDDGIRVWLNGQVVAFDNRYGEYQPDMTRVNVNLAVGENRLLVKVSEWMGAHGFSARFCQPNGTAVAGLTYDPVSPPISYVGTWLLNGAYGNKNQAERLSHDYLGGEANVRPNAGDPAPLEAWRAGVGDGCPFDLGRAFNTDGGWVYSQTVQDRDPPVLFYNLFACGPGRFTDQNYLAGAYIFNTTWGLITVASSKSGSMLNFQDFTGPLGQGRTVGQAFLEWFDRQSPYVQWEREWYYGMVLNGDPTLRPTSLACIGDLNCDRRVDFGDINPFVLLLSNPAQWQQVYANCPLRNGDVNGNGFVDFGDINPFVELLAGPGAGSTPRP